VTLVLAGGTFDLNKSVKVCSHVAAKIFDQENEPALAAMAASRVGKKNAVVVADTASSDVVIEA